MGAADVSWFIALHDGAVRLGYTPNAAAIATVSSALVAYIEWFYVRKTRLYDEMFLSNREKEERVSWFGSTASTFMGQAARSVAVSAAVATGNEFWHFFYKNQNFFQVETVIPITYLAPVATAAFAYTVGAPLRLSNFWRAAPASEPRTQSANEFPQPAAGTEIVAVGDYFARLNKTKFEDLFDATRPNFDVASNAWDISERVYGIFHITVNWLGLKKFDATKQAPTAGSPLAMRLIELDQRAMECMRAVVRWLKRCPFDPPDSAALRLLPEDRDGRERASKEDVDEIRELVIKTPGIFQSCNGLTCSRVFAKYYGHQPCAHPGRIGPRSMDAYKKLVKFNCDTWTRAAEDALEVLKTWETNLSRQEKLFPFGDVDNETSWSDVMMQFAINRGSAMQPRHGWYAIETCLALRHALYERLPYVTDAHVPLISRVTEWERGRNQLMAEFQGVAEYNL